MLPTESQPSQSLPEPRTGDHPSQSLPEPRTGDHPSQSLPEPRTGGQGPAVPEPRPASAPAVSYRPAAGTRDLPVVVRATHRAVLSELAGTSAESGYLAIARLSGHLAAMRRAVCSPLRKRPGAPRELIARCCTQGREAEWSLWLLQGRIAGDMLASSVSLENVYAQLGRQLTGYTTGERALLAWIEEELPAADRERLAAGYLRCLTHGPTRPHPRGPRTGSGFRMAFAFHGFWDRVLDGMESRPRIAPILTVRTPVGRA